MCKWIESVQTDKVVLEVYECQCGFHMGLDTSYLEQVAEIKIECPSCGETIETTEED